MTVQGNPALEAWREVYGDGSFSGFDRDLLEISFSDTYTRRAEVTKRYCFAVPTDEALDLIASYGPVVEIGAGTGYWAELLRQRGCDVAAYDIMGESHAKWFPHGLVGHVDVGDASMAGEHPDRTLLLVWPYMDAMAFDAATAYAHSGGKRLVYVGEGHGGCTATDEFFDLLREEWTEVAEVSIPQWTGIHDYMTVYER